MSPRELETPEMIDMLEKVLDLEENQALAKKYSQETDAQFVGLTEFLKNRAQPTAQPRNQHESSDNQEFDASNPTAFDPY